MNPAQSLILPRRLAVLLAVSSLLWLAGLSTSRCATFTFTGDAAEPNSWFNITNWNPRSIPGPADTIIMPFGSVDVPPGTYADVRVTGGLLSGNFTVGGKLVWSSGTLAGAVTIAANAEATLALTAAGTLTGVLTNHGRILWPAGAYPAWGLKNGRLENASDGVFEIEVDGQFHNFGGTARVNNAGEIRKTMGTGTGDWRTGVELVNTGLIDIRSGGVQFQDGFACSGAMNVAQGAKIDLWGGVFQLQPGHKFTGAGAYGVLGGVATIDGPISDPNFQLTAGMLTITNQLTGTLRWKNGILIGELTVVPGGLLVLDLESAGTVNGVITNHGRIQWPTGAYQAWGFKDGRLENAADGLLEMEVDGQFHNFGGTARVINAGEIRKTMGTGTGDWRAGVELVNNGLIDIRSGGVQFQDGFANSGTLSVAQGAKIDLWGGSFHLQPGHKFTGAGVYGVLGGVATIDGTISDPNFQFTAGMLTITNQLTGTLHWRNGTLVGELTVAPGGLLALDLESAGTVNGVITNHGRIFWPAGAYQAWGFKDGRLENAAEGLLEMEVDGQFHNFGGTARVNNAGEIRKTMGAGTGDWRAGVELVNTGVIDVRSGGEQFLDGFVNRGIMNVVQGSKLELWGGTFHLQPGHKFTGAGVYGVLGGVATIDGPISDPNFQFTAGTLTITNQLAGTLHWRNGTLVGELTVAPGGLLALDLESAGTVNGVITNHGRIHWPAGAYQAWGFKDGRLENASDGLLEMEVDGQFHNFGGTARVNNAGEIRKTMGTGTGDWRAGVELVNTGLIDVRTGGEQFLNGFDNSGTLSVAKGAKVDLASGTFRLLAGHQFTGAGDYGVLGGQATIDGPISDPNFLLTGGTLTITNQLTGTLHWRNGTIMGELTVAPAGKLSLDLQAAGTMSGVLVNHGTILWPAGAYQAWGFKDGRLENASDGLLEMAVDGQFHNFGGAVSMANAGILRKSGGVGAGEFRVGVDLLNSGLIDVLSGELQLPSNFTQAGGRFNFGLTGPSRYGRIRYTAPAALSGTFTVAALGGFQPAIGDAFALLNYPSKTGAMTPMNLPAVLSGSWDTAFGDTSMTLQVVGGQPRLVASVSAEGLTFTWPVAAGPAYAMQIATNLAEPILWAPVTNAVSALGDLFSVAIPSGPGPMFFRLQK